MKIKSFIPQGIILATILAGALVAAGIGTAYVFITPTGEQSRLTYQGDLWCVTNYIEQEPTEYLRDGRPRKDAKLDGQITLVRKQQVSASSKAEAEQKATSPSFQPADKEALRQALEKGDSSYYTTHFNPTATTPGPCLGSGYNDGLAGKWVNDGINEECFEMPSGSGSPSDIYNSKAFTAAQINNYLNAKNPNSPLAGMGQTFVDAGLKYGVNPGFLLGIANAESSLGLQCKQAGNLQNGTNNAFGLTAGSQTKFQRFASYEEGIMAAARNAVSSHYKNLDGTIREFRLKWCGYEAENRESENGTKLSDGSVIKYECKNQSSDWETEVKVVMQALSSYGSSTSSTNNSLPAKPIPKKNRPDYCPDEPLNSGPVGGNDHQFDIARQYQEKLSLSYSSEDDSQENQHAPANLAEELEKFDRSRSSADKIYDPTDSSNSVPLFRQSDPRWGGASYGCGTTIAKAGCGPTSAAMVLRHYGFQVDPPTIARFSLENGYRVCNAGTARGLFGALAKKYGLSYAEYLSQQEIINALKNGQPVVALMRNSIFTSGGHYIVLTGVQDGRFIINDPGPRKLTSAPMSTTFNYMKASFLMSGSKKAQELRKFK